MTANSQTAATPASPVGSYPLTATFGGPDASYYTISVQNSVVVVQKAPLYVEAKSVASTYGQTPPQPTAWFVGGLVNGDTTAVISGAPVLTTDVTSQTPVGTYKIGVQIGTLTATNYYFNPFGNGEGAVLVFKAPLTMKPNNITMTQGQTVPPLTYTLSGFVNSDTAATATSGTIVLFTPATSASRPGYYPIYRTSYGNFVSPNYTMISLQGVGTILP